MSQKNNEKNKSKSVKAKSNRKKTEPKIVGLLGYQATFVGGTKLVVDWALKLFKAEKVKKVAIPVGHFPYVGGYVCEAAATAGIEVLVLSATESGWENFRPETKERLLALLESKQATFVSVPDIPTENLKDAQVYRDLALRIAHKARRTGGFVVALTDTPRTMDDVRMAIKAGCLIRPIALDELRKTIEEQKAELEAEMAKRLEGRALPTS